MIDRFKRYDFKGKVSMKNPDYQFIIYFDYETDCISYWDLKGVYFGRVICQPKKGKEFFNRRYELKERIYLGPTTMDNDLAFIMVCFVF